MFTLRTQRFFSGKMKYSTVVTYPKGLAHGWKIDLNIQNINILLPKYKIVLYLLLLNFCFLKNFLFAN